MIGIGSCVISHLTVFRYDSVTVEIFNTAMEDLGDLTNNSVV